MYDGLRATICYVTLRYVRLLYVTLRYVTSRHVTSRYVTLRYVTLRYVMLCTMDCEHDRQTSSSADQEFVSTHWRIKGGVQSNHGPHRIWL